jgi:hypothetical protein
MLQCVKHTIRSYPTERDTSEVSKHYREWGTNAHTLEACREELQEVLEKWIILSLRRGHHLPEIDSISLNVAYEYEDWLHISQMALERAYSKDEPMHSLNAIKKPNPDYEKRR